MTMTIVCIYTPQSPVALADITPCLHSSHGNADLTMGLRRHQGAGPHKELGVSHSDKKPPGIESLCFLLDDMDGVQMSIAGLLLKMTFDLVTAQPLSRSGCPTCQEGYFVVKNCSVMGANNEWTSGIQCKQCTNCSATDQETLFECSTFTDSQCGSKRSPAVSGPDIRLILTAIGLSLFLILLLTSCLCMVLCRNRHKKIKGLDHL